MIAIIKSAGASTLIVFLFAQTLTLYADGNVSNDVKNSRLVPSNWDAALAGDQVLNKLIRVSAPQMRGAHDAEFVCVGERAYIVEHDNDVQPGHGAGRRMYCVLSVVNLKTLKVEKPFRWQSRSRFLRMTLPAGACFVPRIINLDEQVLRCYFVSEDGGNRQAQTWDCDFNLRTKTFESSIHNVKIKTGAGIFEMQPHVDIGQKTWRSTKCYSLPCCSSLRTNLYPINEVPPLASLTII
ncbi:hypothetical protein [Thalassoglobus sp.]|uniref:hypothetical protein n=1 Tax=Thalassoglobus sp. TaxID=2795869 RepID=UPI003AA9D0F5